MIAHRELPRTIWIFTLLIMGFGLVALYSASFNNVRVSRDVFYDQLFCAALGIVVMFVISRMDYRKFYDGAYVFYVFNVLILLAVIFSGRHALGATRWINLGPISFQPSELTKLALILMLGRYFSSRRPRLSFNFRSSFYTFLRDLFIPLLITGISMFLIFIQPDLGSSILVGGVFMLMLFVSGIEKRYFLGLIAFILMLMPIGWHILRPYQKDRLLVFLNPNIDPLGAGYTIIQSKIAVGSGGLVGKGWLSGTQNQLNFLPERHTDFIFSVIGEEWGLAGGLALLFCYVMIIYCGFKIAENIKEKFGQFVTIGIVGILTLQVIINIGMVVGMFPVVGITLPLVSYGRTSYLIFIIMIGFLLSLSRKRRLF